jgi:hypothetical protein
MKIHGLTMHTTALFMMVAAAFMLACSNAQNETEVPVDAFLDETYCLVEAEIKSCFAPKCITTCGDVVECKEDCGGGGVIDSAMCTSDGGLAVCAAVEDPLAVLSSGAVPGASSTGGNISRMMAAVATTAILVLPLRVGIVF